MQTHVCFRPVIFPYPSASTQCRLWVPLMVVVSGSPYAGRGGLPGSELLLEWCFCVEAGRGDLQQYSIQVVKSSPYHISIPLVVYLCSIVWQNLITEFLTIYFKFSVSKIMWAFCFMCIVHILWQKGTCSLMILWFRRNDLWEHDWILGLSSSLFGCENKIHIDVCKFLLWTCKIDIDDWHSSFGGTWTFTTFTSSY